VQGVVREKISDVGDRRRPRYQREWQGAIRPKRVGRLWIDIIFGWLISVASEKQIAVNLV
jgi:hypothetical protein